MSYVFATALQSLFFLGVLEIFVTFLVIYIGICEFCVAFADDIDHQFRVFDLEVQFCCGRFSPAKQSELFQRLCEIMQFHVIAIQLVEHLQIQIDCD